jgi:hypothetical protein
MLLREVVVPVPAAAPRPCGVDELVQQATGRWWACSTTLPELGPRYTPREQAEREAQAAAFIDAALRSLEGAPRDAPGQRAVSHALAAEAVRLVAFSLRLHATDLDPFQPEALADMVLEFVRRARTFDPQLSAGDLYQAGRNVLAAGVLQALLGLPVQLNPSVSAYSLLYPYSDNLLDDPSVGPEAKRTFNARFRQRLMGEAIAPCGAHEAKIEALIGWMEADYPRAEFPQVWESLLAIHAAQARSVALQRRQAAPYEVDVLGVTLAKGGTSVLADGYLVAGTLAPAEARVLFGLGAFFQLVDDLEDLEPDLRDGRLSVFAQAAPHWPLDGLTNRSLHFGGEILAAAEALPLGHGAGSQGFLPSAGSQPLIQAAAQGPGRSTRPYLRALEARSPVRFAFVRQQRRRLARQRARWAALLAGR